MAFPNYWLLLAVVCFINYVRLETPESGAPRLIPIGLEDRDLVPDDNFHTSKNASHSGYKASFARLNHQHGWCIKSLAKSEPEAFKTNLTIVLPSPTRIDMIRLQGIGVYSYGEKLRILYEVRDGIFTAYRLNYDSDLIPVHNKKGNETEDVYMTPSIFTKSIRIFIQSTNTNRCIRLEFYKINTTSNMKPGEKIKVAKRTKKSSWSSKNIVLISLLACVGCAVAVTGVVIIVVRKRRSRHLFIIKNVVIERREIAEIDENAVESMDGGGFSADSDVSFNERKSWKQRSKRGRTYSSHVYESITSLILRKLSRTISTRTFSLHDYENDDLKRHIYENGECCHNVQNSHCTRQCLKRSNSHCSSNSLSSVCPDRPKFEKLQSISETLQDEGSPGGEATYKELAHIDPNLKKYQSLVYSCYEVSFSDSSSVMAR